MYEVVKTVNGHDITRMVGTRGCYEVVIRKVADGFVIYRNFHTIKAAAEFCKTF